MQRKRASVLPLSCFIQGFLRPHPRRDERFSYILDSRQRSPRGNTERGLARFSDCETTTRAKGRTKMLQEYKTKTNLFILLGIIIQVVGVIVSQDIGLLIRLGGSVLFIIGCCCYAKGKGYHGAWGLLGLLSLIGLIILVCMRDKHKA